MSVIEETYDVCVVGAGHAGCEQHLPVPEWDLKPLYLQ